MKILRRIIDWGRYIEYRLWGSRRGHGCRVSLSTWEEQYQRGDWDVLHGPGENAHYETVAKVCLKWKPEGRILDVGCGEGILCGYLDRAGVRTYVGIDFSREAIKRAKLQYPRAVFRVCDGQVYTPEREFDVIIFNEVIYYFNRPIRVLRQYEGGLKPGGIFIVSMCDYVGHPRIWREIDEHYECLDSASVSNQNGQRWDVRVCRPSETQSAGLRSF